MIAPAEPPDVIDSSVMQGGGAYSAHSRPQHVAAAVAYPYLEAAARELPVADISTLIGDFGRAGGANEMEPMARAIDGLRSAGGSGPIEVVHTDLPQNDFGPLFSPARRATELPGRPARDLPRGDRTDLVRSVVS